ncbi:MAG TPA: NB-ARC domain-containing protein [Thermoleophilaceae bacterium]
MLARTTFFGRTREKEHLATLIERVPLVTLSGVGGAGKTRLASEVAAGASGEVCWCELAALRTHESVAPAVASQLGRDDASAEAATAVSEALAGADVLLVLDNCDQVLEGVAELVERVIATVPDAHILATSREPLGIEGEQVIALGSLGPEALELFADRARLAVWDFEMGEDNSDAVAQICERLDGLPLAIELAAARIRSLSPTEIVQHLDHRFDLLARPRTRGEERHRTLRATVDWSYRLLEEPERLVFERLSVVASSCDIDAARAICGGAGVSPDSVLEQLDRLVERSLVWARTEAGATRYGMLETLREYARDRLREAGELEHMRDLHADWYALLADRNAHDVEKDWTLESFNEGVAAFDEVRTACAWTIGRDSSPLRAFRLMRPLWALAHSRHAREIATMCEAALSRWPQGGGELRQIALGVAAVAHLVSGDADAARARASEAERAEAEGAGPALLAHRAAALVAYVFDGDPEAALARIERVIESAHQTGVRTIEAEMTVLAAQAMAASGRRDEAIRLAESVRDSARRLGSPFLEAWSIYIIGTIVIDEPGRAEACFRESLAIASVTTYALTVGNSLRQLGRLAARDGRDEEAATLFIQAIEHFSGTEDHSQTWDALRSAAAVLASRGNRELAARVLASSHRDPRARAVPPLESEEINGLRDDLDAEIRAAVPARQAELVGLVTAELRAASPATGGDATAAAGDGASAAGPPAASAPNLFRADGELWMLAFDGEQVHMPDLKGLHDLARLMASPGQDLHCLDLAGAADGVPVQGHAGEHLDDEARAAYKRRIGELREELELAQAANDGVRAERAQEELDTIGDALSSAYGLGGRARRAGDPAERARSAVTWRIRSAISRVDAVHPALGRHLRNSIRTGTYCSYTPEQPVNWQLTE